MPSPTLRTRLCHSITAEVRIAVCLWRLATNIDSRILGHLFGIGSTAACQVTLEEDCVLMLRGKIYQDNKKRGGIKQCSRLLWSVVSPISGVEYLMETSNLTLHPLKLKHKTSKNSIVQISTFLHSIIFFWRSHCMFNKLREASMAHFDKRVSVKNGSSCSKTFHK